MLKELYKNYKNRNKRFDKYTTTEYFNYLDAILSETRYLTLENIKELKEGSSIHYIQDTIIGKNIYNAKVITVDNNYIIIKPSGWKNKGLKINIGEPAYICKGYI